MYLLYHDVIEDGGDPISSGFPGASAAFYKLDRSSFVAHLRIVSAGTERLVLTFDDCGASALAVADELERCEMRGLFFAPTSYIGTRSFCSTQDLRELVARGHQLGSHSHRHPIPISALEDRELHAEWQQSRALLEDWLGQEIRTASIPGGFMTSRVLSALEATGYSTVFTSEPQRQTKQWRSLTLHGRYSITRGTSLNELEKVAASSSQPWLRQQALWLAKKSLKRVGGSAWLFVRERLFEWTRRNVVGKP